MPDQSERLLDELLALPYYARAAVVDALLDSLGRPPRPETEARWETEVQHNLDERDLAA